MSQIRAILPSTGWLLSLTVVLLADVATAEWTSHPIRLPNITARRSPPVPSAIAAHPTIDVLALACDDHIVRVLSLREPGAVQELVGHSDWVRTVAYSPDGRLLASAGNDKRVILWDASTGEQLRELAELPAPIRSIAFANGGQTLVAVGFRKLMTVIEVETGAVVRELTCPCRDMRIVAVSPAGDRIAAAGRNGYVHIWDAVTGELLQDYKAHDQRVRGLTFSPDGNRVISSSEDRTVTAHVIATNQDTTMRTGTAKVMSVAFCGPNLVATAGSDNAIRVWDLVDQTEVAQLPGHTGTVAALAFTGTELISASYDTTIRLWQPDTGFPSATPRVGSLPSTDRE